MFVFYYGIFYFKYIEGNHVRFSHNCTSIEDIHGTKASIHIHKIKKKTKSYCTNILTEIGILLAVHRSGSGPLELPVGQPLEAPLEVEQQPNNRRCSEPTHSRNRMQRRISFCME